MDKWIKNVVNAEYIERICFKYRLDIEWGGFKSMAS